jgi:hypothetical protein
MDVTAEIFDVLGGATAIANAISEPVQTVHSWKASKRIPPWRRKRLLDLKPVEGKALSASAVQYLASSERQPATKPAEQPARAA